jgi:superfamily II DNA/RNA helicase
MLVLAPTRELAIQIHEVLADLAIRLRLKAVVVYGGAQRRPQENSLRFADIIVATPGRLIDFINSEAIYLSEVKHFVVDEADMMLDMGFEPDVTFIESQLPPKAERQTSMFSATWPLEIQELAARFLHNPIKITIGECNSRIPRANRAISQYIEVVPPNRRIYRINEIISSLGKRSKVLIFTNRKCDTKRLAQDISMGGTRAAAIHSDLTQGQRENVLSRFKSGNTPVLVATDVASRGLDIPNVEAVINYCFPPTIEQYVHRIGRTGRAGLKGASYTFLHETEPVPLEKLIEVLSKAEQVIPESLLDFSPHSRTEFRRTRSNPSFGNNYTNSRNNNNRGGFSNNRGFSNNNRGGFSNNRGFSKDNRNFSNRGQQSKTSILSQIASDPSTKAAVLAFLKGQKKEDQD